MPCGPICPASDALCIAGFFHTKCVSKVRWDEEGLRGGGCEMTISCSDHGRIILGLSSNRLYIGGSNSESFQCNLELEDFVAGAVFVIFAEVGG